MSRPCTCHPDDIRPEPCPQRYAYGECVKAAFDERARFLAALERIMKCNGLTKEKKIARRALEESK